VLVGLVDTPDGWSLLLTRRTDFVEHHKGQVSFAGGRCEPGENHEQTALREAEEEIALPPSNVHVLGMLDDIWTPSGYIITPVVGIISSIEGLVPSPAEVDEVMTIPLDFFDDGNAEVRLFNHEGVNHKVYFFNHEKATVWGATAFIIRNLVSVMNGVESETAS
jgi:8-oxo-dGTP pyrophosphatase MutT (NUDIX family)